MVFKVSIFFLDINRKYFLGRYVLVVIGDIVVYVIGNVRFIGGVGVVVLLIGLNVSLIFDRGECLEKYFIFLLV